MKILTRVFENCIKNFHNHMKMPFNCVFIWSSNFVIFKHSCKYFHVIFHMKLLWWKYDGWISWHYHRVTYETLAFCMINFFKSFCLVVHSQASLVFLFMLLQWELKSKMEGGLGVNWSWVFRSERSSTRFNLMSSFFTASSSYKEGLLSQHSGWVTRG